MLLRHSMSRTSFNHGAENTNKLAVRFTARRLQLFAFTQNAYNTAYLHLHPSNEKYNHFYHYGARIKGTVGVVCFPGVTTHCGCIFHSPVAAFSLIVFEVS